MFALTSLSVTIYQRVRVLKWSRLCVAKLSSMRDYDTHEAGVNAHKLGNDDERKRRDREMVEMRCEEDEGNKHEAFS